MREMQADASWEGLTQRIECRLLAHFQFAPL